MKRLLSGRESRRGTTALEFALLAVPLLIGLVGGMDGLRYVYTWQALRSYGAQGFRAVAILVDNADGNTCPVLNAGALASVPRPVGLDSARLTATPSCSLNTTTGIRTMRLQVSYSFSFFIDVFGGLTQSLTVTRSAAR